MLPEQEMKVYVKYIQNLEKLPEKKFMIFGISRSGSTLLVNLLNSHPKIHCEGEILTQRVTNPFLYAKCHQAYTKKEVYGFKLLVYHLNGVQEIDKPIKFVSRLHQQGYKLIHLKRKNVLRQALSGLYARHLGTFHMYTDRANVVKDKMHVNVDKLLKKIKVTEKKGVFEEKVLKHIPHLSFTYEDDLMNLEVQQATVDKITNYLEIPNSKIHTDHVKVAPNKYEDFIENSDEVIEAIENSKYKQFLDY
jgi:LPS sulfotransferase NodH